VNLTPLRGGRRRRLLAPFGRSLLQGNDSLDGTVTGVSATLLLACDSIACVVGGAAPPPLRLPATARRSPCRASNPRLTTRAPKTCPPPTGFDLGFQMEESPEESVSVDDIGNALGSSSFPTEVRGP
jgi:hypothetical protein